MMIYNSFVLIKAYVAETSCKQLLLIDSATHLFIKIHFPVCMMVMDGHLPTSMYTLPHTAQICTLPSYVCGMSAQKSKYDYLWQVL